MILDKRNEFCDGVALNTGVAGTYLIGDQIDIGATVRDMGNGAALYLVATVATGIAAGSAGTIQFRLASDDTASVSTTTSSVHYTSPAFVTGAGTGTGTLAAGTLLFAVELPFGGATPYERYLGILQVTGTTAISAGAVNVFLTNDVQAYQNYANAI